MPAAHAVHTLAPVERLLYRPAAQVPQLLVAVDPNTDENLPAKHAVQLLVPVLIPL